jgi:peroxiredoxin
MLRTLALLVVLLLIATPAWAGKFNRVLSVGDAAPAWRDLPGTDEQRHSSDDFKDAKLTVLVFSCNHCPVMRSYESILIDMQRQYAARGVRFVAVSCSLYEADLLPAMKVRAKESGLNFPYLHDESQKIGQAYGATVTPQIFVITAERKIGYMGAIDNGQGKPAQADKHYLRAALDALLSGREPETTESKAIGCGIIYD